MKSLFIFLFSSLFVGPCLEAAPTTSQTPLSVFDPPTAAVTESRVGSLRVQIYGGGAQTLILIPGLSCGSWEWARTIDSFAPDYRVVVVTLAGFDGNPAVKADSLFQITSDDLWKLVARDPERRPIIMGHSLGGTLAFKMAMTHPDRLTAIIAIDGLPVFPLLANASPQQRETSATQMASGIASLDRAQFMAQNEKYMNTVGTDQPNLAHRAAELESRSDPLSVAQWMKEDLLTDLRPSLPQATVPVLELAPYDPSSGTPYSAEQTQQFYQYLLSGAPQCTTQLVSPSRHFAMFDQPEAVNRAIRSFLEKIK